MKLADYCLKYSVPLLKFNFSLIIALQIVKIVLDNKDTKKTVLSCKIDDSYDVNTYELENFDMSRKNVLNSANRIKIRDKTLLISSALNYDQKQFRANRTEIISIFSEDQFDPASDSAKTTFTTSSHINFTELLEFNNFRNLIKLAILLILNLTCLLTNLMLISYLITKKTQLYHRKYGRLFLMSHLFMILSLIAAILAINIAYVLITNKLLFDKQSKFSLNNYVNDLVRNYLNENAKLSKLETSQKSYVHYFIELDNVDFFASNFDHFIANVNVKINIVFMIFSMCLMTFYAYLIQVELDVVKQLRKLDLNDSEMLKNDEKKENVVCSMIFESESDESDSDSDEDDVNYDDVEKFNLIKSDHGLVLEEFQKRKLDKKINSDLQMVLHSVFVIYLLSIWDIADVYQLFRMRNLNEMSRFMPAMNGNGQLGFLASNFDSNNKKFTGLSDEKREDFDTMMYNFKNQDFFYKNKNQFFHQSISQKNEEKLEFNDQLNAMTKKLKTTIKVKIMFLLKTNSQFYANLVIVLFTAIIIHRLDMIERLVNHNIMQYLENRYELV